MELIDLQHYALHDGRYMSRCYMALTVNQLDNNIFNQENMANVAQGGVWEL